MIDNMQRSYKKATKTMLLRTCMINIVMIYYSLLYSILTSQVQYKYCLKAMIYNIVCCIVYLVLFGVIISTYFINKFYNINAMYDMYAVIVSMILMLIQGIYGYFYISPNISHMCTHEYGQIDYQTAVSNEIIMLLSSVLYYGIIVGAYYFMQRIRV